MLRIRDVYPGSPGPGFRTRISDSRSRIPDLGFRISDSGSRIPDLGFRIPDPTIATKEKGEKFFCLVFCCSHKYHKIDKITFELVQVKKKI
jgi:hypothetical protein